MKNILNLLAILFLVSPSGYGQKFSKEFGLITGGEIALETYAEDPEAEAVVLFDIGKSVFEKNNDGGLDIVFTRSKRIKILDKAGLDYAEVEIPYYVDGFGKSESVDRIEAFTYNFEDGKVVKTELDPKTVYEETTSEFWRAKKFAFPNVREGSIIEYKYRLTTPFHFKLPDWYFQCSLPTVYSQYITQMVPFYQYVFIFQGADKIDEHEVKQNYGQSRVFGNVNFRDVRYEYAMNDVPAFKDEDYITSVEDYIIKLDFQLSRVYRLDGTKVDIIEDWEELNKSLLKHKDFGTYINKSSKEARAILEERPELLEGSAIEKAKNIIDFVKSRCQWDKRFSKYALQSAKEFVITKKGTSAELNLFLIGFLNEAGIKASPVLISTRKHGKVNPKYPFSHFFNHVLVLVELNEKQVFYTDALEEKLAFNRIPPYCINDIGLLISGEQPSWLPINEEQIFSAATYNIKMKIDADSLVAHTNLLVQSTEYEGLVKRYQAADIDKYFEEIGFEEVEKSQTRNDDKPYLPHIIAASGQVPIERIDNKLVVQPFLDFPIKENKLKQQTRTYPIDFIYKKSYNFSTEIELPEAYHLESVPENYQLDNELATIKFDVIQDEKRVKISGIVHFKKAVYAPKDYTNLKKYMELIAQRFNEGVVLAK